MNVELLKAKILDLAIHGKLVPQLDSEPAVEQIGEVPDEIPFEIPEKWKWIYIKNLGEVVSGGTPKTSIKEYWEPQEINWVTPADLGKLTGKYVTTGKNKISKLGLTKSSAKLMPPGSIIFSSRAPIGYTFIASSFLCTNQGCKSLIPNTNIVCSEWIYFSLIYRTDDIKKKASGTTFSEISGSKFKEIVISCPPLQEQRRIVAKFNELFSILYVIDAKQKSLEEKLKLIKAKAIDLAIHGKLVPQLDREPAVKQIGEVPDEIPFEIPEKWKWVKLDSISKIINGDRGSNYPSKSKLSNIKTAHPFVSAANISNCRLDYKKMLYLSTQQVSKLRTGFILAGDFLLCIRGSLGKFAYITNDGGAIASSLCIVRFDNNVFFKPFGEILLSSNLLSSFIFSNKNGTAQPNIGASTIKETPISLPPIEEQCRIVAKINEIFSFCDKAMEILHK